MTKKYSLSVGARRYDLVLCEGSEEFESHLLGHEIPEEFVRQAKSFVSYEESLIMVRPGLPSDLVRERVLHEALHAMLENSGVLDEFPRATVERFVSVLAPRLVSFLEDNEGWDTMR